MLKEPQGNKDCQDANEDEDEDEDDEDEHVAVGEYRPDLPVYSAADVAKHHRLAEEGGSGVWVSFRGGVYDVSEFVAIHPGGRKLLLAAGGAIDPFWALYAEHLKAPTFALLEEMRIGNLRAEDRYQAATNSTASATSTGADISDLGPYTSEPTRSPVLIPHTERPYNAEPPLTLLLDRFLTPNDIFYVRNHLPVPRLDEQSYRVLIRGLGLPSDVELDLATLKEQFEHVTIVATLQCGGNRRKSMSDQKEVKGTPWREGAISNASWTGARLRDVLLAQGITAENSSALHVVFEALVHVCSLAHPSVMIRTASLPTRHPFRHIVSLRRTATSYWRGP